MIACGHITPVFFQTAMYVPSDFYGTGFKVTSGIPGSGGVPGMGRTYTYAIRARETGGGVTSNTGAVVCPADEIKIHLPLIQNPDPPCNEKSI
jgi:hypothetical protein